MRNFTSLIKKLSGAFLIVSGAFVQQASAQWTQGTGINGGVYSLIANDTFVWAGNDTGGVYRTSNGTDWSQMNDGITSKNIKAIALNNNRLIAAMYSMSGAFALSDNNGTNWNAPTANYFGFVFTIAKKNTDLYAGTWFGVAKSTNNGNNWTSLGTTGMPSNASVSSIAFSGTKTFAGVMSSSAGGTGVFMTTNDGGSWAAKNSGLNSTVVTSLIKAGNNLYAGTSGGVYVSADEGDSWSPMNSGLTSTAVLSLYTVGDAILAGTSGGIFRSINGGAWVSLNGNISAPVFVHSMTVQGSKLFIGTNKGVWSTSTATVLGVPGFSTINAGIYPNPSKGNFTITLPSAVKSMNVRITNLMGQELSNLDFSETNSADLDMSHLSAGIYFVNIATDQGVVRKSIVLE